MILTTNPIIDILIIIGLFTLTVGILLFCYNALKAKGKRVTFQKNDLKILLILILLIIILTIYYFITLTV